MKTATIIAALLLAGCNRTPPPQPVSTIVCEDATTHDTTYAAESSENWLSSDSGFLTWSADGHSAAIYRPSANERCYITNR